MKSVLVLSSLRFAYDQAKSVKMIIDIGNCPFCVLSGLPNAHITCSDHLLLITRFLLNRATKLGIDNKALWTR